MSDSDSEDRGSSPCGRTKLVANAIIGVIAVASLLGCGLSSKRSPNTDSRSPSVDGFSVDGQGEKRSAANTQEFEERSEALSYFLLGKLKLNEEDGRAALKYFRKASKLTQEPAPSFRRLFAELALVEGEIEDAEREALKALNEEPTLDATLLYAGVLSVSANPERCLEVYQRLIQNQPDYLPAYLLLASSYVDQGSVEQARLVLLDLTKKVPTDPQGFYYSARLYEMLGDLVKAQDSLSKAHSLKPNNPLLTMDLARIFLLRNQASKALVLLERFHNQHRSHTLSAELIKLFKENSDSEQSAVNQALARLSYLNDPGLGSNAMRFKLALSAIESQHYAMAQQFLSLTLIQNPEHARARYYLGSVFAATGRSRFALRELMLIKPEQEFFVEARTFASFISKQLGQNAQAEQAVRDVLKERGFDEGLLLHLVDILRADERYKVAEIELSKAIKAGNNSERMLFTHGVVLDELGERSKAVNAMEEVLKLNFDHPQALNFVAYSLAENVVDLDRAQSLISRALELEPDDGYFLDTQAWIYYQKGQYEQALPLFEQAVNLSAEDVIILEHLADCLVKLGRSEKAQGIYRRALIKANVSKDLDEREAVKRIQDKLSDLQHKSKD